MKSLIVKHRKTCLIFLLAFFLRIIFLVIFPPRPMTLDDATSWDAVAWNFLHNNSFTEIDGSPTSNRPPLYPMFLSAIYFLFGRNYFMVKIFQALMGAIFCVTIFSLAKKIFDNKRIAFLSAVGCSLWPALIVYTGIIGSEILFTFLLILFLLILTKAYITNSTKHYLLGGIFLGLANLTRSTLVFYPLFLIILIILLEKRFKKILPILMMFLISMIFVLPWTIRNYNVFGRFLLVNTGTGELFWSGTYIPWDGICKHGRDEHFYKLFNLKNPVDNEREMFREGIKNIRENPAGFIKLSIKKFSRFWFKPIGQELTEKKYYILGKLLYIPQIVLILLFLYGAIAFYTPSLLPIITTFIYFGVMHNLITPLTRYRLPIEPLIIVFAIAGLSKLVIKNEN